MDLALDAVDAQGIGTLAEPVRRDLYLYVAGQTEPVGREAAAAGVGVPVHKARFHLDRLVDSGLLEVEFRRLTGRSGPGAGRPAKLYRRARRQFEVSLPSRRYDLVGHILAAAVNRAGTGAPLPDALAESAESEGRHLAAETQHGEGETGDDLTRLGSVLATQGYEPRVSEEVLLLGNCPFEALAKEHTELVCGLNQSFVQGVADGLGSDVDACLEPAEGRCCVTGRPRPRRAPAAD